MELRPGVTTRRVIVGRGTVVGTLAGLSLGALTGLLLVFATWPPLRVLPAVAVVLAAAGTVGALAGLVGGLALTAQRDRVLLNDPRARVMAGAACAIPFLALLAASVALGSSWASGWASGWASVAMFLALWCGVAGAMFGTWIVHGTLSKAPSAHD